MTERTGGSEALREAIELLEAFRRGWDPASAEATRMGRAIKGLAALATASAPAPDTAREVRELNRSGARDLDRIEAAELALREEAERLVPMLEKEASLWDVIAAGGGARSMNDVAARTVAEAMRASARVIAELLTASAPGTGEPSAAPREPDANDEIILRWLHNELSPTMQFSDDTRSAFAVAAYTLAKRGVGPISDEDAAKVAKQIGHMLSTERRRWMLALAEAVHEGRLTVSQEACVVAHVNGYIEDDPAASVLDEVFYFDCRSRLDRFGTPSPSTRPASDSVAMQDDMTELLRVLGLSDHARDASPRAVMQDEIIPAVRDLVASTRSADEVTDG